MYKKWLKWRWKIWRIEATEAFSLGSTVKAVRSGALSWTYRLAKTSKPFFAQGLPDKASLFSGQRGALTTSGLRKIIKGIVRRAKLDSSISPHWLTTLQIPPWPMAPNSTTFHTRLATNPCRAPLFTRTARSRPAKRRARSWQRPKKSWKKRLCCRCEFVFSGNVKLFIICFFCI